MVFVAIRRFFVFPSILLWRNRQLGLRSTVVVDNPETDATRRVIALYNNIIFLARIKDFRSFLPSETM